MGRLLKRAGLVAVALIGFGLVAWIYYSRAAFGVWNPMAQPTRITYCDRTYLPGPHVTRVHLDAVGNGFGIFPFRQVAATANGTPIFAKPLPDSVRHKFANGPVLPCGMNVYLRVGADDFVAYGISGGP